MVSAEKMVRLGAKLRAARESIRIDDQAMTQFELAVASKLTTAAISRYEMGAIKKPAFEDMAKLVYVLGWSLDDLARELGLPVRPKPEKEQIIEEAWEIHEIIKQMPGEKRECAKKILRSLKNVT
jgi:transcriptional regulator with XRE-family HTH domain